MDFESLNGLKTILGNFKRLSGLSTNYDKTIIMHIGDLSGEINDDIKGLGFRIVDSFKLLGFHISNTGVHSRLNVDPIKQKIRKYYLFLGLFLFEPAG